MAEDDNSCVKKLIFGVGGVVALLIVILVPMSFSGMEYYEVGTFLEDSY